jgi:protein-S-isoprenylcysteine O-methyltransferase Ste14
MRELHDDPILALWLVWLVYWFAASLTAKTTRRRESFASRLSHIVPLLLGTALLVSPRFAGPYLTMRYLPYVTHLVWYWSGFCLVAIGLGFSALARIWLGRNWSGIVTLKQDHELIRGGPYRFVRHPIYTGLLLAVLGSAIAMGEWRGLLGLALFTIAFLHKIRIEEQFLTEQFGPAYARYRAEVPALIPMMGRGRA